MPTEPAPTQEEAKGKAAAYYTANMAERSPYLLRARRLSSITVPNLFRMEGANGSTDEMLPWSSFGAYVVNNLAASFIFALFPPGRAPIKISEDVKAATAFQNDPTVSDDDKAILPAAIEAGLSKVEMEFADVIEEDADRAKLIVGALRMIVGGQQGFQFYPDGTLRGIPLDDHVTRRKKDGSLLGFCLCDEQAWEAMSDPVRAICLEAGYDPQAWKDPTGQSCIKVYTHGRLQPGGKWVVYEECWGKVVPGTYTTYSAEDLPFFFPTWTLLEKEHYGRGYAEDYEADLQTCEGLTQTIVEGAAAAARFLTFVNPAGLTDRRAVAEAANGAVIAGRAEDVTPYISGKMGDIQIAATEKGEVVDRLNKAFLLNTAVQRNAERVTAEEIRYVAGELEKLQGGVYSLAVVQLQMPYCKGKLRVAQSQGRVTPLPAKSTKIKVIGGLGALGRTAEADALVQATTAITTALGGPQVLSEVLGPNAARVIAQRIFAAFGVDTNGIIPTPQEAAQLDQQKQQQAMLQQLGPEAIKQIGQNVTGNQVADTNAQAKLGVAAMAPPAAAPAQSPTPSPAGDE